MKLIGVVLMILFGALFTVVGGAMLVETWGEPYNPVTDANIGKVTGFGIGCLTCGLYLFFKDF